jgi:antitoxin component YwqK of YwqJK toxin-antitoxin module
MFKDFTKYEVYDDGRIWSYKSNKFLKPATQSNGYQTVSLSDNDGKIKNYLLHRVVYEAVTGEPIPENLQVNHISEDKTDCSFENLNLMTPKENTNYGTGIERSTDARSKQVGAFKNGELIMSFSSIAEADRNGFDQGAVGKCCRNCFNREGNNVYKGYEWKYI